MNRLYQFNGKKRKRKKEREYSPVQFNRHANENIWMRCHGFSNKLFILAN